MKILDKRIANLMQEEEFNHYAEESLKNIPDCSDKCEYVDIELLMSQIPLRNKKETPDKEEIEENTE